MIISRSKNLEIFAKNLFAKFCKKFTNLIAKTY